MKPFRKHSLTTSIWPIPTPHKKDKRRSSVPVVHFSDHVQHLDSDGESLSSSLPSNSSDQHLPDFQDDFKIRPPSDSGSVDQEVDDEDQESLRHIDGLGHTLENTFKEVESIGKGSKMSTVRPPKEKAEYSANWKKLLSTMEPKKRKRKGEDLQKERKHKRLKKGTDSIKERKNPGQEDKGRKQKETGAKSVTDGNGKTEKTDMVNGVQNNRKESLVLDSEMKGPTKALAMDCEMVGVGKDGVESELARVSLVNQHGHCVYDKFVRPREKVTDFRTHVSGVRPSDLHRAEEFLVVQQEVSDLLKGRILVGHALHNDFKVLFLDHPKKDIRDTARYKLFRELSGSGRPSLKKLSAKIMGVEVQQGEHNSVQDAQAAMALYMMHRKRWETDLYKTGMKKKTPGKKKKKQKTETSKKVHFESGS